MYPKLVALDTDGMIFTGELDQNVWGKGPHSASKLADNIQHVDNFTLQDRSNHSNKIHLAKDIPRIVTDILKHGASLAIVSRNTSKALCNRALYYFKAEDPESGEIKSIIKLVRYDEVVDEPKMEHFKRISGWSKYDYSDMILFDNEPANNVVQNELGMTYELFAPSTNDAKGVFARNCSSQTALTWEDYTAGINEWRRRKEQDPDTVSKPDTETTPNTTVLNIAHFNDVYQVSNQKIYPDNKEEVIDVTKFGTLLANITDKWNQRDDGSKDGLVIFSGDIFSPSTESSITRGKHMPVIADELGIDAAVVGNHEFDFGFPRLKELINATSFPWLLSNIVDTNTGKVPLPMKDVHVLEKDGLRIGFIGLVEKEWIATITGWPENFKYQDMAEVGRSLSAKLRDPAGEYRCDIILALTHSRIPNDIKLARSLFALSPNSSKDISSEQGVDLLLGGHDHIYWISKGFGTWDGYDVERHQDGAEDDQGDVLIVKSGTDFQDLSELILVLKDTSPGSIRKKVIQEVKGMGKRHVTRGSTPVNEDLKQVVDHELGTINAAMEEPIFITDVKLDVRSSYVRLNESPMGNWIADCIRHAYDEALVKLGYGRVDCVIACTGDFRGDNIYEPGPFTLGNLMTVLPYLDPTVVLELDANSLWDTLESGLSRWPVQEGRFPALSGLRVVFDGSKPAGQRVKGIWLLEETQKVAPGDQPVLTDKEEVLRNSTRKYLIMCGEYMAEGGDGYDVLKRQKQVITGENGQSKSALIRKFLLGAQFLNKKVGQKPEDRKANIQSKTADILSGFESQLPNLPTLPNLTLPSFNAPSMAPSGSSQIWNYMKPSLFGHSSSSSPDSSSTSRWMPPTSALTSFGSASSGPSGLELPNLNEYTKSVLDGVVPAVRWIASQAMVSAALAVAENEDMGLLDSYERQRARITARLLRSSPETVPVLKTVMHMPMLRSFSDPSAAANEEDAKVDAAEVDAKATLPVIHPVVDGRLKNLAKS